MPLNCGIIGLPTVGKTTIFTALTRVKAEISSYSSAEESQPGDHRGAGPAPGQASRRCSSPSEEVPATVEFVDIAGLASAASKKEGGPTRCSAHIRDSGRPGPRGAVLRGSGRAPRLQPGEPRGRHRDAPPGAGPGGPGDRGQAGGEAAEGAEGSGPEEGRGARAGRPSPRSAPPCRRARPARSVRPVARGGGGRASVPSSSR
ncbi:MAG: 50S ribosome-binding GTPase [Candidatus Moduliflexus flocculans]|nr:50S ribosome-binding GTPase [Candidatus Moduliflexus flocculans]